MAERILLRTTNLIDLYMHSRGVDEVPNYFHLWACLSMIAACVGNRVYFHRLREIPLYPNLYVMLVDESGTGKNRAIDVVENFVSDILIVNYKRAKLTAQFLIDLMGKDTNDETPGAMRYIANPRVFLTQPELAFYFPKGRDAQTLVETLTELYGGSCSFMEGTRTSGGCAVRGACINWLSGTTKGWLVKTVTPEAIESGFFARVAVVYPESNPPKQVLEPKYPEDYWEVVEHIKARVQMLSVTQGEMFQTERAKHWMESWLANRKEPEDSMLMPAWRRQRELIYRLAMVMSLADGGPLIIDLPHVIKGEKLSRFMIEKNMPDLVQFSARTPATRPAEIVKGIIRKMRKVDHSTLLKRAHNRGVNGAGVKYAVMELQQQGEISNVVTPTGGKVYKWKGGSTA